MTVVEDELAKLRAGVEETSVQTESEIKAQLSAFDSRLTESEATLATQRETIAAAQERQSETFSEAQEERAKAFEEERSRARAEIESIVQSSREEVERHVDEIRRMESESSGLVGSIGLAGTAERYGEEQVEQKRVADFMRWVTISFAIGAVAIAAFAVVHQADDNGAIAAKLGVSLVLGGIAAYTARQSGRHRTREERARNLQLELTAFAPFIEPLDKEQQDFERVIMTRRTFGQIRALPEVESDHSYGPLGPVLDKLPGREADV